MFRKARVIKVYAHSRRADIAMLDNNQRFFGVEIMSTAASTDGGSWSTPSVKPPASELSAGGLDGNGRQIIAMVAMVGDRDGTPLRPVVMGFLHCQGGQVNFTQDDRDIHRHPASGAYFTFAPDGSMEMWHPSGAYIRIGAGGHENLAPLVFDDNWVVPPYTGAPVSITISCATDLNLDVASANFTGSVSIDGNLSVGTGASGSFTTPTGQTVTVRDGIITNIY